MRRMRFEQLELRRLLTAESSFLPVLSLAPAQQATVGFENEEMDVTLLADINADGIEDLIFSSSAETNLFVALNDADWNFSDRRTVEFFGPINDVAAADLNDDGLLDLVAASDDFVTTHLNLGNDENGQWRGMSLGDFRFSGADAMAIGDVTGDGVPELVLGTQTATRVGAVNTDGTIDEFIDYGVDEGNRLVELTDLNGDGSLDIVTAIQSTNRVVAMLNDGTGIFEEVGADFVVELQPAAIELGDVNNDDIVDLVIGHQAQLDGNVTAWTGNGDGTFSAEPRILGVFGLLKDITIADFDGDDIVDIIASHDGTFHHPDNGNAPGGVSVLIGNQLGGFHDAIRLINEDMSNSFVRDINGDDKLDLISVGLAGNTITKFHQRDAGFTTDRAENNVFDSAPVLVVLESPNTVQIAALTNDLNGSTLSLLSRTEQETFAVTSELVLDNVADSLFSGDFDGDGESEILALGTSEEQSVATFIDIEGGSIVEQVETILPDGVWTNAATATLNNDDLDDFVAVQTLDGQSHLFSFFSDENGIFTTIDPLSIDSPFSLDVIDVNGDHLSDIGIGTATNSQAYMGTGNGSFEFSQFIPGGFPQFADFNGDGATDAIVQAGFFTVTISQALGNFDGSFQSPEQITVHDAFAMPSVSDINADDRADFLIGNKLFLGQADGVPTEVELPVSLGSQAAANDYTGDGLNDLVVLTPADATTTIFNRLAELTGGDFSVQAIRHFRLNNAQLLSIDIDQDGDADTLVTHSNGFAVLTNDLPRVPGDLNGDGIGDTADVDALCSRFGSVEPNDLAIFDLNSDGAISAEDVRELVEGAFGTRLGDADLNGEVSFLDFLKLASNFGDTDATWSQGDFDCSGDVSFFDFILLATNFGFEAEPAAAMTSNEVAEDVGESSNAAAIAVSVAAATERAFSSDND